MFSITLKLAIGNWCLSSLSGINVGQTLLVCDTYRILNINTDTFFKYYVNIPEFFAIDTVYMYLFNTFPARHVIIFPMLNG